ncbi:MAG: FAD-binding oxidoreductase, partial [Rhodobacteraceae bacterium]|nr:FAD-binding oxidoreductase [Paracoccaceae bacterium]
MLDEVAKIVGAGNVATGSEAGKWSRDWTGNYISNPLGVARPSNAAEVSTLLKWANETKTKVVPVSGNTGLCGGTKSDGALMISTDRMNKIREVRPASRIAIAEAGVILDQMHTAAGEHDLIFPLTFGARGSCMIGGVLSTNAGGSNVLRYGNTRDLVLGVEAVLPTGEILNLMTELHKDNSGYNLKHLLIGAEGTLGI